jgi:hypothetical protein
MPGRYSVVGEQGTTTATPGDSALAIEGGADQRPAIYDWTTGFGDDPPADRAIRFQLFRTTTASTGDAVTPEPLDPADPASLATVNSNVSAEGAQTGVALFDQIMNQRATYRWVAAPGGELIIPATALAGITFVAFHASYTGSHEVTAHFID